MILFAILLGTVAAGVGSVWLAALMGFRLARFTQHMLSLAAGALLATAFLNLLPEAFESNIEPHNLFALLLGGVVLFFLLDKAELWHHGHEHHDKHHAHHDHEHPHGHADHQHANARSGGWSVLAGDSVHAFGDGVLIASAFVADLELGWVTALAVLAHEIPHHMGDLVVVRMTSTNRRLALLKVSLAGTVTALGGVVGYLLVSRLNDYLPYFLVLAASSFVYVALADLIPQLQKHLSLKQTAAQVAWLAAGVISVLSVSMLSHGHG